MNMRKLKAWREQHGPLLAAAMSAVRTRQPYNPFSDELADYDPALVYQGEKKFNALLGSAFRLEPGVIDVSSTRYAGAERSPYGFDLDIAYPCEAFTPLVDRAEAAMRKWQQVETELRCALLCEVITRLHADTFLFAHVGMHTSGHGLFMGFHANAIHAQARALESVANVCEVSRELSCRLDNQLVIGEGEVQRIVRDFSCMPAGLSLVYAGQVVPTWGAYPGLFASLAAGCPVILVPHANAILPIALTVKAIKAVCAQVGLPGDIVNLLHSDNPAHYRDAALHGSVRLIDYMGGSEFGGWLRQHAWHARVMTLQSAQTAVFVHSTADYDGMLENLAFGLCSYSAQLCTSPQNIYVLSEGVGVPGGRVAVEQFQKDLVARVERLLERFTPPRELLGAVLDSACLARIRALENAHFARVLRRAEALEDADFPGACIISPSIIEVRSGFASAVEHYAGEVCGPVSFMVQKQGLRELISELRHVGKHHGMLGLGLYTQDGGVENALIQVSAQIGAVLSVNFCKNFFISQCSVFTDIHGGATGPAADVTYGGPAFYHARLRMTERRKVL